MLTLLLILAAFGAVAALVGAAGMMMYSRPESELEGRLDILTGAATPEDEARDSLISGSLADEGGLADQILQKIGNLSKIVEQAGLQMSPNKFLAMTGGAAAVGTILPIAIGWPIYLAPFVGLSCGALPFAYLVFRRKKRLGRFAKQLPEALELISRALRAGHSLAAGFALVGEEMSEPIATEFARCYEEQNLGVPLDESIEEMTERVPNLDLRFFATAIILQRQTGGDLAEILDKIGYIIRERFKIWGQIQALTGEGRLSGIVLLGLPPCLFITLYRLNPSYCMILFDDPMGQQMLAVAGVMQILGALVIKKIINIKV